jgi:hypothetical protein
VSILFLSFTYLCVVTTSTTRLPSSSFFSLIIIYCICVHIFIETSLHLCLFYKNKISNRYLEKVGQ